MFQKQNQKFKGKKAKYSSNVICDYYRKQCHEEVDYYRLIGFSDDFQFTNDKGFRGHIRGNTALPMEDFASKQSGFGDAAISNQNYNKKQ